MTDTTNQEQQQNKDTTIELTPSSFEATDLDSLNEFEWARITSKTWSMGQD